MPHDKDTYRKHMRMERLNLSPDVHETLSLHVCKQLLAFCLCMPPNGEKLNVAGYSTTKNEADIYPFLEEWLSPKFAISLTPYVERRACLPRVEPDTKLLRFLDWRVDSTLVLNRFAIAEPEASAPAVIPDIILVPLLAFDRKGNRLGYGGGYYDATLKTLRQKHPVTAVGVGFGFQEIASVPADSFDEPLDFVITEREIIHVPTD